MCPRTQGACPQHCAVLCCAVLSALYVCVCACRCIIDDKPRQFDANSCNMLANMAEMVLREIEKEKMLEEQRLRQQRQSEQQQLLRAIDCFR